MQISAQILRIRTKDEVFQFTLGHILFVILGLTKTRDAPFPMAMPKSALATFPLPKSAIAISEQRFRASIIILTERVLSPENAVKRACKFD